MPLLGLLVRAPWSRLPEIIATRTVLDALVLSLITATSATAISLVLGVPLAWVLARSTAPGMRLLRALVTLPLVLPPVVGGVALLLAFGREGIVGQWLDETFGVTISFTTVAVVLAETFVAMPFLIMAAEGAFRTANRGYDEAAATLGAGRWYVFSRVTVPLIRPSLVAGAVLCWARALGEFGATITFAGQLPGDHPHDAVGGLPRPADRHRRRDRPVAPAPRCVRDRAVPPPRPPRRYGLAMNEAGTPVEVPGVRFDGKVTRGDFELDVAFDVAPGEVLGVLGPNGAGKTTLLRAIAGLEHLSRGSVVVHSQVWQDEAIALPPEGRAAGVVFQDYRLFPHLDVRDNVAFAARAAGVPKAEARARAATWLTRLGLAELARRRPAQLSGGQSQRVALARALATEPRVLLLDEPMAALDAGARIDVRAFLREHLTAFAGPVVLVTHDPLEAMVLADRLLVIEGGRAVQQGTPAEVSEHPASSYVARLVGLNLWPGTLQQGGLCRDGRRWRARRDLRRAAGTGAGLAPTECHHRAHPPPGGSQHPQRVGGRDRHDGAAGRPGPAPGAGSAELVGRRHPGCRGRARARHGQPRVAGREGHRDPGVR